MKISTLIRILIDRYCKPPLKDTYWGVSKTIKVANDMLFHQDMSLRTRFRDDLWQYFTNTSPSTTAQTEERGRAAANWLIRAQKATPDDGVSLGYFPHDGVYDGWRPSYPETTGYIMTSLFDFARRFDDSRFREAAIKMGKWEITIQMPSGAVQGGPVTTPDKQTPAAFNTGMVLDGWCSAYESTHDPTFLEAARKAADFLVADLDAEAYFKTNGYYVSTGEIKTYTCLCAWAIYRFGSLVGDAQYQEAAIRSFEAALRQQQSNGWFAHNCLAYSKAPLTHTLGYTLQGILEVGLLSGRDDFIAAVRLGIDPILEKIQLNGYLPGRFYADWEPASFSSCLTGTAQIAIVCYRLAQHTGIMQYKQKADTLVNFLKGLQVLDSKNSSLNGAIGGSFPLLGHYMRAGYPNWATKYFLDALILQDSVEVTDQKDIGI
jgi:uncharacterized protein YyaL (SSP411 family)